MMTTMTTFSIQRFGQTMKWFAQTNRNPLMRLFMGMYFGFLFMEMFLHIIHIDMLSILQSCVFVAYIYILVGADKMFSVLSTKQRRTAFLMQPASNTEKFITRYLFNTLVWLAGIAIAFVLADTTRVLLSYVLNMDNHSMIFSLFSYISFSGFFGDGAIRNSGILLIAFLWVHSVYMLGGTLFRRYSFFITSAILIAFMIVLALIAEAPGNIRGGMTQALPVLAWDILAWTVTAALVIFNYAASFRQFRKMQIIH